MKFAVAALMAIVALSDTTEARARRYNGISRDCTNTKFTIIEYSDKNCKNQVKREDHKEFEKCDQLSMGPTGVTLARKCYNFQIEYEFYKGGVACKGKIARIPKAWGGPKGPY